MPNLTLFAPLRGWCAALDEAPDAVFAERLLGDGVAIDPTGDTLHAPCDGEVVSVAASRHAVVIRAANGAEVLLHVGIDTVELGGDGFTALIETGARVRAGEPLLRFDLDVLARGAKSLLSPIVVTNGDGFALRPLALDRAVRVGDALLEIAPAGAIGVESATTSCASTLAEALILPHAHGIHARPAALIARFARGIAAEITVTSRGRNANARSAVSLMALGARHGDTLTLAAAGDEAEAALGALRQFILDLPESAPPAAAAPPVLSAAADGHCLRGVIASRGFAAGNAVTLGTAEIDVIEGGRGVAHENTALDRARAEVRAHLDGLVQGRATVAGDVLAAHVEILDDCELLAMARRAIADGHSAAFAWRRALRDTGETLLALDDPRMAERIDDLRDLEAQVLRALNGDPPATVPELPERAIVIARDLTPSQVVALDAGRVAGLCLTAGGPTSHVALLAQSLGVPALVALGPRLLDVADGTALVLDAERGVLDTAPDADVLAAAEQAVVRRERERCAARAAAQAPSHTADGVRIPVLANLGSLADAELAVASGAEGCGLLRTEFLFLDRDQAPDENEQRRQYERIARALDPRPLVVRTLDIGGDKPIPYLPLPPEANPALGLRGVRTSLWRPDLLETQLRAILTAVPAARCRVLLPMISDPAEIAEVRALLDEVRDELGHTGAVPLGAMIETPAAAVTAARIAAAADFLSIGTNDLTQYALAMDRTHAGLAHRLDALHPAVLRLIAMSVDGAAEHSRPVTVCGGLASDPAAVPILIGLGVAELSVVPALVPDVKRRIRSLTVADCQALAREALDLDSAAAVRALVDTLPDSAAEVAP